MESLNLPEIYLNTREVDGKLTIFDTLRKKYIVLTPEEWVRQHFVHYLIKYKAFPKSLIKLEGGLHYNSMSRRSDILVYDRNGAPFLLVECKSSKVQVSEKTFSQAAQYNQSLKAPYLVVTNGLIHYCCKIFHDLKSYEFMEDVPAFPAIETNKKG